MGCFFFFFQAEDGIRDVAVTGVQTCALPIFSSSGWCRAFETVSAMMCARSLQERRNSGENHKDEHRVECVLHDRAFVPKRQSSQLDKIGRASCRERV